MLNRKDVELLKSALDAWVKRYETSYFMMELMGALSNGNKEKGNGEMIFQQHQKEQKAKDTLTTEMLKTKLDLLEVEDE